MVLGAEAPPPVHQEAAESAGADNLVDLTYRSKPGQGRPSFIFRLDDSYVPDPDSPPRSNRVIFREIVDDEI